jgi:hypothetical protein
METKLFHLAMTLMLSTLATGLAHGAPIFKCRSDSGVTTYSSTPCHHKAREQKQLDLEKQAVSSYKVPDRQEPPPKAEGAKAPEPHREQPSPSPDGESEKLADAKKQDEGKVAVDPKSTPRCIEIRRRLPLSYAMSEGCL